MALTKVIGNGLGTLGDGTANDTKIVFDGNAQDYHIGLDDSADTLVIGKGSALGTTTAMSFDENGIILKPLQPAFLVEGSGQTNLSLNATTVITFGTPIFDQNSDFDTSTETFTAPVTGKYQFNMSIRCDQVDITTQYTAPQIFTSNKLYSFIWTNNGFDADLDYITFTGSVLADMDAGDTCQIRIYLPSLGTAQLDVIGGNNTFFSGYLVC